MLAYNGMIPGLLIKVEQGAEVNMMPARQSLGDGGMGNGQTMPNNRLELQSWR